MPWECPGRFCFTIPTAEQPFAVVSRPFGRDYTAERLCGDRLRDLLVDDYEQGLVSQGDYPGEPNPASHPGQELCQQRGGQLGLHLGEGRRPVVSDLYEPAQSSPTTDNPTGRWDYGPDVNPPAQGVITPLPIPAEIPEYFSDTIVVNGAAWPYVEVQPRYYRFRILNGSQARFYNLQLYYEGAPGEADLCKPGPGSSRLGPSVASCPSQSC